MSATAWEARLEAALDSYGADFARWPDQVVVAEARVALLADRGFRARWESAASLDRAIAAARELAAGEVRTTGAAERVAQAVLADTARPRRWSPRSWAAAAAALVLAAGLGSYIDFTVVGDNDGAYETVLVDPLVFGPAAAETR